MEAFVLFHFRPFDLFIFLMKLQKLPCSSDFFPCNDPQVFYYNYDRRLWYQVPRGANINFLLIISIHHQEKNYENEKNDHYRENAMIFKQNLTDSLQKCMKIGLQVCEYQGFKESWFLSWPRRPRKLELKERDLNKTFFANETYFSS